MYIKKEDDMTYTVKIIGKIPFKENAHVYEKAFTDFNEAVRRGESILRDPESALKQTQYQDSTPNTVTLEFSDKASVLAQGVPEKNIIDISPLYTIGKKYQITLGTLPVLQKG